jgi:hypothetical protein
MKKFLYLIMSDGKINEKLSLLNSRKSDTLVLTWKKPIKKGIFFPFSTWTTGRNRLYQEIVNKGLDKKYLYFIFMDGDFILKSECQGEPFKIFEKYLEKYLPAIGFPDYYSHDKSLNEISIYYNFDGGFFAIHRDALHRQFPYPDNEDKLNWCYSQLYFGFMSSILYRGSVIQFNSLKSANINHKHYGKLNRDYGYENFIKSIKNQDTLEYFKQEFLSNLNKFRQNTKESNNNNFNLINQNIENPHSYCFDNSFLHKNFDHKHPLWRRRLKIKRDITNKKSISGCELSYIGEYSKKTLGTNITHLLFSPIIKIQMFLRSLELHIIISNIGKIGKIIRNISPRLFIHLKRIERRIFRFVLFCFYVFSKYFKSHSRIYIK